MRYKQADTKDELLQILQLQRSNLRSSLGEEEMKREGFVSVEHTLELVQAMNEVCGHVIAVEDHKVAGYTLCMHPDFRDEIPMLEVMFQRIDKHLGNTPYMVMGQVCVAPDYRGKGVFRSLYSHMQDCLRPDYEEIVTEVDERNQRSLQAHLGIGFRVLEVYESGGRRWYLVSMRV